MNTTTPGDSLTPRAKRLFARATAKSESVGIGGVVGVEHLLFAMLDDPDSVAFHALARHVDIDALRADLTATFESEGYPKGSALRMSSDGTVVDEDWEDGWTVVEE